MPRTGPRRERLTIRLDAAQFDALDQAALEEGIVDADGEPNRSEIARIQLDYAAQHRPPGWRPTTDTRPAEETR